MKKSPYRHPDTFRSKSTPTRLIGFALAVWMSALLLPAVYAQSRVRFTPPVFPFGERQRTELTNPSERIRYSSDFEPTTPNVSSLTPQQVNNLSSETLVPSNQVKSFERLLPQRTQKPTLSFEADAPIRLDNQEHRSLPLPPPIDREELRLVLAQGEEMEKEGRWADALTHYESALRAFHNESTIVERFRTARFHYDIERRMHDTSYLRIVQSSGFTDVLNLFEEIISKIQNNYVDLPHWDALFRNGVQDLEIAVADPLFRTKAGLNASNERVNAYLKTVRETVNGWEIRNREDLKNGILRLAEIGQQQIALNPSVVLLEFTCGVANSLDPYTSYLTPNQLNDTSSMISGNFVGLGVELKSDRESLIIVRVISGSPAKEGGLLDGDRILTVNGVSTKGQDTNRAADMLQGEENSVVRLVVQTFGQNPRELRIMRRRIEVASVEDVHMLDKNIGYIRLTGFQTKTCDEMKKALWDLNQQGMKSLVLDLRHNPGGLLHIGVEVANLFIESGPIVRTRGRSVGTETPYQANGKGTWKMPLIVLIDEESASASEIVAGALRDYRRAVLVGKRSFGKGTIQAILSINGGHSNNPPAGLRLTTDKFYSPSGLPFSEVGVMPHVQVDTEERYAVGRPNNGRIQVATRSITSSPSDPFIRQALSTLKELNPTN